MIKIKRWPVFGNGKFNVISLVINFNKESKKRRPCLFTYILSNQV